MCCRNNKQSWEVELHSKNCYDDFKMIQKIIANSFNREKIATARTRISKFSKEHFFADSRRFKPLF